jgi:hypothetical protein
MDIYDEEIQRLTTASRIAIMDSWYGAGPLFQFLNKTGKFEIFGFCPTMVKGSIWERSKDFYVESIGFELTRLITDSSIPPTASLITNEHLPEFAKIQRAADRIFQRDPNRFK